MNMNRYSKNLISLILLGVTKILQGNHDVVYICITHLFLIAYSLLEILIFFLHIFILVVIKKREKREPEKTKSAKKKKMAVLGLVDFITK